MRPNGVLVNIARGDVVDQAALVEALEKNSIEAALLDVTDPEPLPEDHPLWASKMRRSPCTCRAARRPRCSSAARTASSPISTAGTGRSRRTAARSRAGLLTGRDGSVRPPHTPGGLGSRILTTSASGGPRKGELANDRLTRRHAQGIGPVHRMPRSRGLRIYLRCARRREPRLPRQPQSLQTDQAGAHAPRTGRRLHGRDLWAATRARPASASPRSARRDQFRHRRRLCATGRHADDDDHRPETDQEIETGPVPDPRRGRDDGSDYQIHAPAACGRQHSQPRARSLSPGGRGKARRGASRIARGYCRGTDRRHADPAQRRAAAQRGAEGGRPGGRRARTGQQADPRHRRGRQSQDDRQDAGRIRREDGHSLRHDANGQGRARRNGTRCSSAAPPCRRGISATARSRKPT